MTCRRKTKNGAVIVGIYVNVDLVQMIERLKDCGIIYYRSEFVRLAVLDFMLNEHAFNLKAEIEEYKRKRDERNQKIILDRQLKKKITHKKITIEDCGPIGNKFHPDGSWKRFHEKVHQNDNN